MTGDEKAWEPQTAATGSLTAPNTDVESKGSDERIVNQLTDEYPHGLRLITVVAAVMLTVFLTSLDQVSRLGFQSTPTFDSAD